MFRIIWVISIHLRNFMRRYMPTNILLDAIRTRRGQTATVAPRRQLRSALSWSFARMGS